MVPITDKVSNAINLYQEKFKHRLSINELPTQFESSDDVAIYIESAVRDNEPFHKGAVVSKKKRHTKN